ncbi:hypothetical protein PHACT_00110 [Pseudohongiella acticola]|uniref:Glycosyltransferase 2-like domain-containing protein n=2 Tax=Pseudohongiella acticola TaxID=1524254 RepID=A0A1E8CHF7_9GAMM|nr:hypothetical protein PHACT_00110 [Pseudohongiella acticola]
MPVFNGEEFIEEALESLLAQSFSNFELIISDNASTDSTEAICRNYARKDARVRYFRQTENLGSVANFKFVLEEAVGEYFMWAAADDLWAPNFIEKCRDLLVKDEDAGMAMTAYVCSSRFSELLKMKFENPLACISIEDRAERVRAYSKLPFSTHKDNLVYALWRKRALVHLLSDLVSIANLNIIGTSMNEYALAMHKGRYSSDVGFYKRYRYVPPGHFLDPLLSFISRLKRRAKNRGFSANASYGVQSHLADLRAVLISANFTDDFVSEIVQTNIKHLNGNRHNPDD